MFHLGSPLSELYRVGPKQMERLEKLNLLTVRDLLFHFPRRYEDYSQSVEIHDLQEGISQTIKGRVTRSQLVNTRRGMKMFKALLSDGSGVLELTWFNQAYLQEVIREGEELIVSGVPKDFRGSLGILNPSFEVLKPEQEGKENLHVGRIVPVYPETAGLTSKWLRSKLKVILDEVLVEIKDQLPTELIQRQDLLPLPDALKELHFPTEGKTLQQARERLGFEELFFLQLKGVLARRAWVAQGKSFPVKVMKEPLAQFTRSLPFQLTSAQQRAVKEILQDVGGKAPMNRLLEGDVGSGKTVVAVMGLLNAVVNGYQGALMAPTEILAQQHFYGLIKLLEPFRLRIALLTAAKTELCSPLSEEDQQQLQALGGSVKTTSILPYKRDTLHEYIALGNVDIVIGTHSLIQDRLHFHQLSLAVIDEQHRFGVEQRGKLTQQHGNPDVLVMTATPIPRTLALALYGDLELSIIDELPAGRKPIVTRIIPQNKRERAYEFVRKELDAGRQVYVICPLVEESEKLEVKSAVEEYERLQNGPFRDYSLGLLHGRLPSDEKQSVIECFRQKEIDLLVSTSVVEVGVDVPNASIMLIEGAERFGISQLHQFRGRVGRGEAQSYCLLFSDSDNEASQERLQALVNSTNGFELAEEDLKLRGPGEVFGTKQSGIPDLKMASLLDAKLLKRSREEAERWADRLDQFPQFSSRLKQIENDGVVWN